MLPELIRVSAQSSRGSIDLSGLIEAIGTNSFYQHLQERLATLCGVDYFAIMRVDDGGPRQAGAFGCDGPQFVSRQIAIYLEQEYWRVDPSYHMAERCRRANEPTIVRLSRMALPRGEFRDNFSRDSGIHEEMWICGGPGRDVMLNVLRSERNGTFSRRGIGLLAGAARTLLSIIARHERMTRGECDLLKALTSLDEVERRIARAPIRFSKREVEVCARILYGLSTVGVAADLNLSEPTVATYRKRAYARLKVGSQRELLLWYIGLFEQQATPFTS
jgi:DNA-binding CsgD family transcriptional regulator